MAAGCGAPVGWAVIQAMRGINPVDDLSYTPILYAYLLFGTMLVFALFGYYVGCQEARMQQLSWRDPLTGLYNRRYFRERLDEQMASAGRENTPVSLVYFDIDHFKHVNDTYGHAVGDDVLISLSRHVGHILRHNEIFARVGGEEFVVMVSSGGLEQASQLAGRIMHAVRKLKIEVEGGHPPVSVSLSLGVVEQRAGETLTDFLGRADAAMYAAKQAGRNQMVIDRNDG